MFKKPGVYLALLVMAVAVFGWLGKGFASSGTPLPGSEGDPLVTRAYVDGRVSMTVIELAPGDVLKGFSGTEIILRSGKAIVMDSDQGGLCDVTQGVDLRGGAEAPANHLLIVPRDDGRGVKASTHAFVMIRGNFIKE